MGTNCQSCGMPLAEEMKRNDCFCTYCSTEDGKLKSREEVREGIAQWLEGFAPSEAGIDIDFSKRAERYLQAMPAWAD